MKLKETVAILNSLAPNLFTKRTLQFPKVLPIGVHNDLIDRYVAMYGVSKTKARPIIARLLKHITNRKAYWKRVINCKYRCDIEGKEDLNAPILEDHKLYAKSKLAVYQHKLQVLRATRGEFDKVVKSVINKHNDFVDLNLVFAAAGRQLILNENLPIEERMNLIDKQAKRVVNKLYTVFGIHIEGLLKPEFNELLASWFYLVKGINAIQINSKVIKFNPKEWVSKYEQTNSNVGQSNMAETEKSFEFSLDPRYDF